MSPTAPQLHKTASPVEGIQSRDPERTIEFEFVRATENAALNAIHWAGRGDKEIADAAACDAIYGTFDLLDVSGEVVIGEGIKDNAPGIFLGEKLGNWKPGTPRFDIALDPVDGTTNLSKGFPNAIAVIAASQVVDEKEHGMMNLPAFYSHKFAYGPKVAKALAESGNRPNWIDQPLSQTLEFMGEALGKRVADIVVQILDRPRNQPLIDQVRASGACLRMVSDGDIAAAVAPALPDSGVDLYAGIGGSPEAILAATALRAIGGDIQVRMWFKDDAARDAELEGSSFPANEVDNIFYADDLCAGDSAIFCATGIIGGPLLPGVRLIGKTAVTHSLLMRAKSRTVRFIRAVHDLETKTIHLRSDRADHKL